MDEAVIILIRGIGSGAVYTLVAMSLNVIYNATGVLNFAQGQLLVVAGVFTYLWYPDSSGTGSLPWIAVLLAVTLVVTLVAALQGWLTLLPMRSGSDQHSWIVTTIAASIVIGAVMIFVIGPRTLALKNPFGFFPLAGTQVPYVYLAISVLAVVVHLALRWFQRRYLVGLALNALSQDLDAARTAGISTLPLQVLSFAIAGAILGLTGYLGGHVIGVAESNALHYVIFGFIVAVVGGLGNNTGALVAGPVFGVLLMLVSFQLGGSAEIPLALAVIVIVLMLRPEGIFGRLHARRV
ncbi:branched-chain amino acid ABC transporter permease [Sphaerisporangium perillae]|uniref:branched-chain amino acid ABC transporter permease n=1 Tax=Sphaerisporangium perillae TaxID=2935860 RepID=UPI00200DCF40|nr:branched-chain amino acid ABC transporter permease [Sphaerisporangium perillae]